jgi:hypothetical protein
MRSSLGAWLLAAVLFVLVLIFGGCRALDPAGPYNGDSFLYHSDLVYVTSYDVVHTFVAWEHANRDALKGWPRIKQSADNMRLHAKDWFATARAAREAYVVTRSGDARSAYERALEVLRIALAESTRYLNEPAHNHSTP